jgi:MoxR-like ATPase
MASAHAGGAFGLAELFAQGASGFTPNVLQLIPRPWDAPPPTLAGEEPPPAPYLVDPPLAAAAWVALLLRQPLLLTGDPGVGKTRFAEKWAGDLGIGPPTKVQVKSTTRGRDLLYTFDDLGRFRDATIAGALARQMEGKTPELQPLISYINLQGLGRAILRAAGGNAPLKMDPAFDPVAVFGARVAEKPNRTLADVFPKEFLSSDMEPRHTVVLIDELDKAPRDTPNDLLAEIEGMTFQFDELGFAVEADPAFKPIVVITSNAERNLPDAFLRRCVFHHIATPTKDAMCKIAAARLVGGLKPESRLVTSAWTLFESVASGVTEKKPGTAEFIGLVAYLQAAGLTPQDEVKPDDPRAIAALRVITKTKTDLLAAAPLAQAAASAAALAAVGTDRR